MSTEVLDRDRPGRLLALVWAARPRTLVVGAVPVAAGSALAYRDGTLTTWPALGTLAGALLIQIGTNLANDTFDWRRGADTADRVGPPRATQRGWLGPDQVLWAALCCFGCAALVGVGLVLHAGPALLPVGLAAIAAGYLYTGGPVPLAYSGWGDAMVLVFFGPIATAGTFFVHSQELSITAVLAGLAIGALGVALLAVNNLRDAATDRRAGKRTMVVRFGARCGRLEYLVAMGLSLVAPPLLWLTGQASASVWLSLLALPFGVAGLRLVFTSQGERLNAALLQSARYLGVWGAFLALGLSA